MCGLKANEAEMGATLFPKVAMKGALVGIWLSYQSDILYVTIVNLL